MPEEDQWARWLQTERFSGGEREQRERDELLTYRDTILANARVRPDDTVLDVGAGDGLVGLEALNQLDAKGHVILSDISSAVLAKAKRKVENRGEHSRVTVLQAPATDLSAIPDDSVDVVTMRSVLVYVVDTPAALAECYRVLSPGGRLSLFEPLPGLLTPVDAQRQEFFGYDVEAAIEAAPQLEESIKKIRAYRHSQGGPHAEAREGTDRDLFGHARDAGFVDLQLTLSRWDRRRYETEEWDAWLDSAWIPGLMTKRKAIEGALSRSEQAELIKHVKPLVESRTPFHDRGASAYLWGNTPE